MIVSDAFIDKLMADHKIPRHVIETLQKTTNNDIKAIGIALIKDNYISREDMGNLIGNLINYTYVELSKTHVNRSMLQLIPQRLAEELEFIPLYELGDNVTVTMASPEDKNKQKEIAFILNKNCSFTFSFGDEIKKQLSLFFHSLDTLDAIEYQNIFKRFNDTTSISKRELEKLLKENEFVRLFDALMHYAMRERASDIHIEPYKHHMILRLRIDGRLHDAMKWPIELLEPIINRLKILSSLDITEKRIPLDGKFVFTLANENIDIRVSTAPTIFGEKAVLRILSQDASTEKPNLFELGIRRSILRDLEEAAKKSNGMLFVTGPTGAGKTTTLYAIIDYIKNPEINIVTIEDPVEYQMQGITQIEVNTDVGRDFATVLRSILRQDPDVILIGEIRDLETGRIATTAALTGHLVLTTLHTNNAVQAITRMTDMGVPNFVVAPSIIGVVNQRLVRMTCPYCKEPYIPDEKELALFSIPDMDKLPTFYRGKGCDACNFMGFKGRIPIMEYIKVNHEIRSCILENANLDRISQAARASGYKPLRYDGLLKVMQGLTTLDEVLRVSSDADTE